MASQPVVFKPSADIEEAADRLETIIDALDNVLYTASLWRMFQHKDHRLIPTAEDVAQIDTLSKSIADAIRIWAEESESTLLDRK